ncbi:MAG TPA: hypothetical protein VFR95_03835 [Gemmatimonadaceae bacterium]|nr:hypothetical protein [Gemmatimonadaceae bacterium]
MRDGARMVMAMVVVMGGCVRTGGVGSYARAAGETAAEFPALAQEMTASCVRLEGYREAREGKGWADRGDLEKRCADRERAVRRAVAVDRVLASYFAALGALAEEKVVKYDASIDDLADALEDDAKLDAKKVRAVSDLAAFTASVATDGYRKLTLTKVIEDQNANVAAVVDALADIVGKDYTNILDLEAAGMDAFYRSALVEGAEREPLAAILVRDRRDERAAQLEAKRAALDAYVKALATMKKGHQRLYDSRRDLDAKRLAGELADYAAQLEKMISALRDAY